MHPGSTLPHPLPALQGLLAVLGGGEVRQLRRLSGGASQETWAFDRVHGQGQQALVLRRAPGGAKDLGHLSAGLASEFELLRLALAAGVPVPAPVLLLGPEMDLGRGYLMGRIEGETLGRRIVGDDRFAHARSQLARQCGLALARIHALPLATLPQLRCTDAPREVAAFGRWHAEHGTLRPVFDLALQWLTAHLPTQAGEPALVHGDFRNGNLMVDEQGLVGVLDWELAHCGDPMEDLGWICVNSWRFGRSELAVGGFGQPEELFQGYRDGGGQVDTSRVHFWQVMGTLKWGLICDGMAQAWLNGDERQVERAAIGRRASEAEIDLLDLLCPLSERA